MPRATQIGLLVCSFVLASQPVYPQSSAAPAAAPAFEAATIKPPDPAARYMVQGFYGKPGGRVFFGGPLKMLIEYAFNLRAYQIIGGPDWTQKQRFEINAVPPDTSPSRKITGQNAEPTAEQRLMLQSLLRDRFGLKFHLESKEGEIYILERGRKPLQLKPPKDPASDPRAAVVVRSDGIDGEAFGNNATMEFMAQMLSRDLQLPVLDQTGINGSYDFNLPATDPGNHDMVSAVIGVVDRLGLTIKRGRGPIQTLIIDHVEQPSEN